MTYQPDQPYNHLPNLPPPMDLETKAVLKLVSKANRALAELKGQLSRIPNPTLMTNAITLQEARFSSEIENIVTTQDNLFKAASDPASAMDSATKEVIRYRQAIWHGFHLITRDNQPFSTRLFVEVVRQIKGAPDFDVRRIPGTKLANPKGDIIYVPPVGETVIRNKLANLEAFYHDEALDWDPLIKMAVGHYQFEAIHPFQDGNGRTGRVLNILYLVEQGLLDWPVLYLSRFIIKNKDQYYTGLRHITEQGAWEPWVLFMLEGVAQTAQETLGQVNAIVQLTNDTKQLIQAHPSKFYTYELLELIFEHPYCKVDFLVQRDIAKRQTAAAYLKALVSLDLLEPFKVGREVYYLNKPLMAILKG
jgi:Fic family protein